MAEALLNVRSNDHCPTGVDRVATELTRALNALICDQATNLSLHSAYPPSRRKLGNAQILGRCADHLWEQFILPFSRPDLPLLSLRNTGPLLRRNQVVMFHDAQVHSSPESYSRAFRGWYKTMQPLLARRATKLVTISKFSRSELERHRVIPKGKAHVIYNGADHILRLKSDKDVLNKHALQSGRYFLAIGGTAKHKNLETLIRATKARQNASIPLVVAGHLDPSSFKKIDTDNIHFLGRVSDSELRALYENATAFLFPSSTEGFGLPPLEAMYCRCPVIASTGGAIPEVCGPSAYFCDPHDPNAWTIAMEKFTNKPQVRAYYSQKGAAHAPQFTWDKAAKKLRQLLTEDRYPEIGSNPVGAT